MTIEFMRDLLLQLFCRMKSMSFTMPVYSLLYIFLGGFYE